MIEWGKMDCWNQGLNLLGMPPSQSVHAVSVERAAKSMIRRQLQATLGAISDGVVFQDTSGRIVDCNPAAERILGLSADQMLGKSSLDPDWYSVKEDGSPFPGHEHPSMVTMRTKLSVRNFVFGVGSRDRSRRWISVNTDPIFNDLGELELVVTCFRDVTAEKEQSRSLEFIVNAAKVGTWDWDIRSGCVTYNSHWAEMLGYDLTELEANVAAWEKLLAPGEREQAWKKAKEHLEGKTEEYRNEMRLLQRDGTYRWVLGIGRVISRDLDNNPLRMVGIQIDVSDSKRIESQLQELTGRYEAAVLGASDGLWDCACDGDEVWYSKRFWTLIGYPDSGPFPPNTHQSFLNHLHPEDVDSTRDAIQKSERDGTSYEHQYRLRLLDGTYHWFLGRGNVQIDEQGKVVRLSGTIRDIHEIKLAEIAASKAQHELKAASAAKSEFLANMSHEIRTPMTAILGFSELLAIEVRDSSNSAIKTEYIETIQRNGDHLLELINDILDISKIEADKVVLERLDISLLELLQEVVKTLQFKAKTKGIELNIKFDPEAPKYIHSDPSRLRQILINLIGNAIKFTEQGSVTVQANLDKQEGNLLIAVVDTGIGLTDKQIDKLFNAFEQADASTTRKYGGTGLGLRISKRLSQLLGGDIFVESEFGRGSTFTLLLNKSCYETTTIGSNDVTEQTKKPKSTSTGSSAMSLTGLRILLVEDGPDNQRLISYILRKAGATVEVAENGKVAVCMLTRDGTVDGELLFPQPFSLIVSDILMPEIDGYFLAKILLAKGSRLPMVALTANAMSDDAQKCLNSGFSAYTSKPIDKDKLIATCHACGSVAI